MNNEVPWIVRWAYGLKKALLWCDQVNEASYRLRASHADGWGPELKYSTTHCERNVEHRTKPCCTYSSLVERREVPRCNDLLLNEISEKKDKWQGRNWLDMIPWRRPIHLRIFRLPMISCLTRTMAFLKDQRCRSQKMRSFCLLFFNVSVLKNIFNE